MQKFARLRLDAFSANHRGDPNLLRVRCDVSPRKLDNLLFLHDFPPNRASHDSWAVRIWQKYLKSVALKRPASPVVNPALTKPA
jgi:hypothetical protein